MIEQLELPKTDEALTALSEGKAIVLQDRRDKPTRAALVFAAEHSTTSLMAFAVRHSSGLLTAGLPYTRTVELEIPCMDSSFGSVERMCVSVDAAADITTGISASDRGLTARLLANTSTTAESLIRPGHLMVTAVDPERPQDSLIGTALTLVQQAGCSAAVLLADLVGIDHPLDMAVGDDATGFARTHSLVFLTADQVES